MLLTLLVLATAPDEQLMKRLAQHAEATADYGKTCSVTVDTIAEEYDSDGKTTKTTRSSLRVTRRDGKESRRLTKYEENGVDLTEKKRKEVEGAESKPVNSPFHPAEQPKYRFTQLADDRIGFAPAGDKTPDVITGEATIDVEAGAVRFVTMQPSKMPAFVDALTLTATFDAPTPIGKTMSKLTIKGTGGFLFIKKRFGVVTTFHSYEPQKDEKAQ